MASHSRPLTLYEPSFWQKSHARPRERKFRTAAGPLILRSSCSPSLVASLKAEQGLHAFAHTPEREHQLLLEIAQRSDSALTLAYTPAGEIVGQLSMAPADAWWQRIACTYEIGGEVSVHWRRLGIARQLLSLSLEHTFVEETILVGLGLSWHWDIKGSGLSFFSYRLLLRRILESYGFFECTVDEPNVGIDPVDILLVRLGRYIKQDAIEQLFRYLHLV